jgi:hypothetical protein
MSWKALKRNDEAPLKAFPRAKVGSILLTPWNSMHLYNSPFKKESGQFKQKPSSMVQLRSNKALIVRHLHTKLNPLLEEFHIPLRPTMATESIVNKYNEIREKGLGILELRKQVEKAEHDLKVVQAKRAALESGTEPPSSTGKKDGAVRKFWFFLKEMKMFFDSFHD